MAESFKVDGFTAFGLQQMEREKNLKHAFVSAVEERASEEQTNLASWLFEGANVKEGGIFHGCSAPIDYFLRGVGVALHMNVDGLPQSKSLSEAALDIARATGELVVEVGKSAKDFVEDHPVATAVVAGVVTGGAALAAAGPIAAKAGALGWLGAASTGTEIASLSGAALESAALAKLGGGALAAGGGGAAAGTATVTAAGVGAGAASATAVRATIL